MENLERHILHLITRHNCVILPGFGAFLAQNVSAHYNADEQMFIPPHRTICFNPQITIDDALLVSSYITSENKSYDEARNIVTNEIASLRRTLSRNSEVQLGNLGTFQMDLKGDIRFIANDNGIDDPHNFGFEPLSVSLLRNIEETITIPIERHKISKYIAAVVAIVVTFLFVTPVSDSAFQKDMQASLTDFASSEQISMMQQLTAKAPSQVSDKDCVEIAPVEFTATKVIENIPESAKETDTRINADNIQTENIVQKEQVADNTTTHYIIVASSPNEENAQLAIKELTAKMNAEYTVVKCGKRHRIAINSYTTAGDAQNALSQYQQTFPDAWVLSH